MILTFILKNDFESLKFHIKNIFWFFVLQQKKAKNLEKNSKKREGIKIEECGGEEDCSDLCVMLKWTFSDVQIMLVKVL